MPGNLRPYAGSILGHDSCAIIIAVPGVGTDPAPAWRPGSILPILASIAKAVTRDTTYIAWWDHGLLGPQALSFQRLHESAEALRHEMSQLCSRFPSGRCPIFLLGHSIGGILVKEALNSWLQSSSMQEATDCVAGVILLGVPHTWDIQRALGFCKLASFAFSAQPDTDYGSRLIKLCKEVESSNTPTFSIYESEKTGISRVKRNLIVERELARIGIANESLWQANKAHKDLCHYKVEVPMYEALRQFFDSNFHKKSELIHRPRIRRASSSIRDKSSLPPSVLEGTPWLEETMVDSPLSSNPTSFSSKAAPIVDKSKESIPEVIPLRSKSHRIEYQVPPESKLFFRGDDILKPVEDVLSHAQPWQEPSAMNDQIRTFALCGPSGLGKSASAGHFVHKHRHNYGAIFWVNAEDTTKLFQAYTEIAFKLGLADPTKPHDKFQCQKVVKEWFMDISPRRPTDRGKWLLVLDKVTRAKDLKYFWPHCGYGDILITSQCSLDEISRFTGQFGIEVKPFGKDVAFEFLRTLSEEQIKDPGQLLKAKKVAEMLGGSPLALVALSSLLKQGRIDDDLVRKISKRRDSASSGSSRPDLSGEPQKNLALVIDPILDELAFSLPLMELISMMDPTGIEEWILMKAANVIPLSGFPSDAKTYREAKQDLVKRSLITEYPDKYEIACDPMICEIVKQRMGLEQLQRVFEAIVTMLSKLWPNMSMEERHNVKRWSNARKLLGHVRKLQQLHESPHIELTLMPKASIAFANLLNNAGWLMYERGEYEDARSFAEHARRIWQSIDLDGPNVDRHDLLDLRSQVAYSLGTIAQITHQKRESLQMNTEMLVLRKTLKLENGNGPGDPLLAHAYNELGSDFMADDEYEIAEGFYKRSIMVYESVGHDFKKDWLILPSVNLGLAYWLQGRYRDAEEIVLNTLLEQEMMLGADDGITMKTGRLLYAMGNIAFSLGKKDESLNYHQRAFKQFEKTVGTHHNASCDVMYRLADHYAERRNYEAAIEEIDKALNVLITRPLFEREMARLYFKRANIMKRTREFSSPSQYRLYEKEAFRLYTRYGNKHKHLSDLTEKDFNDLVMFWSR